MEAGVGGGDLAGGSADQKHHVSPAGRSAREECVTKEARQRLAEARGGATDIHHVSTMGWEGVRRRTIRKRRTARRRRLATGKAHNGGAAAQRWRRRMRDGGGGGADTAGDVGRKLELDIERERDGEDNMCGIHPPTSCREAVRLTDDPNDGSHAIVLGIRIIFLPK